MKRNRPVIGVTLDSEKPASDGRLGYSAYPWYALRENYMDSIADAGGLPVALAHHAGIAAETIERIEALVVTGGAFDVDPDLYDGGARHRSVVLKAGRTAAELALLHAALACDMPTLGICGGQQLLAVALGGTLIQHLPDEVADALPHEQPNPRHQAGHAVEILPGTMLHRIVGGESMMVNSSHHQAVRDPGSARINARAPDGVIEGIEDPRFRFCLGLQWHPEFLIDTGDARIFAALVDEAGRG